MPPTWSPAGSSALRLQLLSLFLPSVVEPPASVRQPLFTESPGYNEGCLAYHNKSNFASLSRTSPACSPHTDSLEQRLCGYSLPVGSPDAIDVTQYTLDEMKVAVEAADDWGTYVTVHAYTLKAVRRAVEAGVKCIEHGQLLDKDTVKLLGEKGIWLSLQVLDPARALDRAQACAHQEAARR